MSLPFENHLKKCGANNETIRLLKKEEIEDLETLGNLNENDISDLGLSIGQRCLIRKLSNDYSKMQVISPTDEFAKERDPNDCNMPKPLMCETKEQNTALISTQTDQSSGRLTGNSDLFPRETNKVEVTSNTALGKEHDSNTFEIRRTSSEKVGSKMRNTVCLQSATLPAKTGRLRFALSTLENDLEEWQDTFQRPIKESQVAKLPTETHGCDIEYKKAADDYMDMKALSYKHADAVVKMRNPDSRREGADDCITMRCMCLQSDNQAKVILELNTSDDARLTTGATRILLLVDVSGSMLLKCGKTKSMSKISLLKQFAQSLIDVLDDGDQAGLVTFGETANILLPLQTVTGDKRKDLKDTLESLTSRSMSSKTNLSAGLATAIEEFRRVSDGGTEELIKFKNCIIVFSDGEINEGTLTPHMLVHESRERIRQIAPGLDEMENQWVSISVVTTGDSISESIYLLSKTCSSDSYLYIDADATNPDAEIFLPVLLRKSAVAWNVSLEAEVLNGAEWISDECTQHNRIRLTLSRSSKNNLKAAKAFFYYDIPAGSSKHIGLVLDVGYTTGDGDEDVLKILLRYTDYSGERHSITKIVSKSEMCPEDKRKKDEAVQAVCMQDTRLTSEVALRKAADHVKSGDVRVSVIALESAKIDIQAICQKYGDIAERSETKNYITQYVHSVVKCMQDLIHSIKSSGDDEGHMWSRIKAVSSALTREAPTTSNLIINTNLLCPLPPAAALSPCVHNHVRSLYEEQGVRNSTFENYHQVTKEFKYSLKKRFRKIPDTLPEVNSDCD